MADRARRPVCGFSRFHRAAAPLAAVIALCGCSINLDSLSSVPDKTPPAAKVTSEAGVSEAQTHARQGEALARAKKNQEALAEFDQAIGLDPNNAQALFGRGLLYQGEQQHQLAIDDFTAANGLEPQQSGPLLARATSYLALNKAREAAVDLDEAVQADPQNEQIWVNRGLAYERLGDKTKAAGSYGRAVSLRPGDEAARSGLARVAGKTG
jgi:tetratricopeptide (TPR) repeat protein